MTDMMTNHLVTGGGGPSPEQFYEMKAQLNSQDREIKDMRSDMKEIKSDIRDLLAIANRGRGGLWMAVAFGGLVGGIATVFVELFTKGH